MDQKPPFDFSDFKYFKDFKPPKINLKAIAVAAVVILVVGLFLSTWFTIEPEEVGVVLQLGKYTRTVNPGLNFKLPFGIEQVYIVPVV